MRTYVACHPVQQVWQWVYNTFNSSVTASVVVTMTVTMAGQDSPASTQAACKDAASKQ